MRYFPDPNPVPQVELIALPTEEEGQAGQQGEGVIPIAERSRRRQEKEKEISTIDVRLPIVNEFLRSESLEANSRRAYERALRRFVAWVTVPFAELKPSDLARYRTWLEEMPSRRTGKPLSRNSVNLEIAALKSFFGWLNATYPRMCPTNPAAHLKTRKVTLTNPEDISEVALQWIWQGLTKLGKTETRDTVLLHLLMHGLRADEIVGLSVGSFDGEQVYVAKTKTHAARLVPLSVVSIEVLEQYLQWRQAWEANQTGELIAPTAPLLVSIDGSGNPQKKRLTYSGLYQAVGKIGKVSRQVGLVSWAEQLLAQQSEQPEAESPEEDEASEIGESVPLDQASQTVLRALVSRFRRSGRWSQEEEVLLLNLVPESVVRTAQELEDLHPHNFRHTYATQLLLKGLDPAHARKLTGHQSQSVFKRYTERAEQEAAIRAFRRMEELGGGLL